MKKIIIGLCVVVLLCAVYCGAWLTLKKAGDAEIDRLYADAAGHGVALSGPAPRIEGFPFVPHVTLNEGIKIRNWQASFSSMTISGFPLPGMPITVEFPGGIIGWVDGDREPVALDYLSITARGTWHVPSSTDEAAIRAWRDAGGKLDIIDSFVMYEDMELRAEGTLSLDDALQPEGTLTSRTKGYAAFIQKLTEDGRIKPIAGIALLAALNNFAQPDPDTQDGEMVAELPVTIRDRGLYVGPVLLETLPAIVWDNGNPPALHQ